MKGFRKEKQKNKTELVRENDRLRITVLELEAELEGLHLAWQKKFALLAGIFEAELENAGTLGEMRRWYKDWKARIEALDENDPDVEDKLAAILDEYDIDFSIGVTADEMVQTER